MAYIKRLIPIRRIKYRRAYPSIFIDGSTEVLNDGQFIYNDGCIVSENCKILISKDARLSLGLSCYNGRYVEIGPTGLIQIGDHTSIQDRSILVGDVIISRYCLLSLNVLITYNTYNYKKWPCLLIKDQDRRVSQNKNLAKKHSRQVEIGEDCWIGVNSVIMPGIYVGRGAVIGSNSVVTSDVSPYTVVAGVPEKVIKKRLDFSSPKYIQWDNDECIPYFYSEFEIAEDERLLNRDYGGLVSRSDFSLQLAEDVSQTTLTIKAFRNSASVALGKEIKEITDIWSDTTFTVIKNNERNNADRSIKFSCIGCPVVISEAHMS